MSTKTNFKRIALVAVAALGLGVLSSVPAANALGNLSVTITNGSFSAGKADSTTAATIAISGTIENVNDTITVSVVSSGTLGESVTVARATNSRAAIFYPIETTTATRSRIGTNATMGTHTAVARTSHAAYSNIYDSELVSTAGNSYEISSASVGNVGANFAIQVESSSAAVIAGTYGFTVIVKQYSNGVAQPITTSYTANLVVAAAAAVSDAATATYAFANLSATSVTPPAGSSATDEVINALATVGANRAFIYVGVRNASNGKETADESITATVTGVGLVCLSDSTSCGKSLGPIRSDDGDYQLVLRGDGSGGTSTVKVTTSVTGSSYTKSLTYYAAAAKTLTASVYTPLLAVGGNDSAVAVTAVDAAGATWGGQAYIYASAAADATAVGGSATAPVACVFRSAQDRHYCPITATAAGTGKFKVIDAATVALATATSNEVSVTSKVATPASIKLSFNKASYAPGEIGLIIVTPLDAAGAGLPATSITNGLASGGVSSNLDLTYNGAAVTNLGSNGITVTTVAYNGTTSIAGSQTYVFSAPLSGGTITLTAKGGDGLPVAGRVAISASATITDNGAAALAAVTALATTVASLKTLITTLTNLVLKIQKKVKA
jgi:hypothetical protein